MTIVEAIYARHSVRQYLDKPIEKQLIDALEEEIADINREGKTHFQLVLNEPKAMDCLLAHYGKFKNAVNYIALVAPKDGFDEAVGYYGERLVLKATTLGLCTCWVAGSYKKVPSAMDVAKGEKLYMIITVGYGENEGKQHRSRSAESVSDICADSPEWFKRGVELALLAPTAINQQKFYFAQEGDKATAKALTGPYSKTDLGIVKYHFEIGAGKGSDVWK